MSRISGTTTLSSIGIKTIALGFQPTWANFKVCSQISSQNFSHMSEGEINGTFEYVVSTFQDISGGLSANSLSKVVSVYERISGTITEVLSARFDSWTATGVKLDVTIANSNYQVILTAGN